LTASYVLSSAAETDLRDIVRYTRKQRSDAQTRSYLAKLKDGIKTLPPGRAISRTWPRFIPACGWCIASIIIFSA
jgi:toxin ParE1/3/4